MKKSSIPAQRKTHQRSANKTKYVYITTGDTDGIGLEVTAKALLELSKYIKNSRVLVYRSSLSKDSSYKKLLRLKPRWLVDVPRNDPPPFWVREVALKCKIDSVNTKMVTGPLSKQLILDSGISAIGHTEILKKVSKVKNLYMTFIGPELRVVTLTGHCGLKDVPQRINAKELENLIRLVQKSFSDLTSIGVLGLNPHAGEGGLFGNEEQIIKKAIIKAQYSGIPCAGPLVPDAAFAPSNRNKHNFYICMYHDQALVPFKALHGWDGGFHMTLGLPFTRVSVDHGTAKDIFNKNLANAGSMKEALKFALNVSEGI